jgi:hypothetical protein
MSKRTDYLNGDNSGTDAKLDRIAELEGGQLINRNAIARKDARITELEAALRNINAIGWVIRIKELETGVDEALRSFEMTGNSTHLTRRLHAVLTGEKS